MYRFAELAPTTRAILEAIRMEDGQVLLHGDQIGSLDSHDTAVLLSMRLYSRFHAGLVSVSHEFRPHNDPFLEQDILAATPFTWRSATCRVLDEMPGKGGAVVELGGLRVFVPESRQLSKEGDRVRVRMRCASTRLSAGFVSYTSRLGSGNGADVLRLYRHATSPDEAIGVWTLLIQRCEELAIPFRTKILCREAEYPRNDAIVVYLPTESRTAVSEIADLLASTNPLASTSALARTVRPGVAMAWEPSDPGIGQRMLSFGEHRAGAIAEGACRALRDATDVEESVVAQLIEANIDPTDLSRNLDSPIMADPTHGGGRS